MRDGISGFLVVLQDAAENLAVSPNKRYRGAWRIPEYPSPYALEEEALESYVFELRDDHGLLPDLDTAERLLSMLALSPRRYEIIYIESTSDENASGAERPSNFEFLGYDVLGALAEGWSILGDFPPDPAMEHYLGKLNRYGLFSDVRLAHDFKNEYVARQLADYHSPFVVVRVERVA
jgi:hypothetical protein